MLALQRNDIAARLGPAMAEQAVAAADEQLIESCIRRCACRWPRWRSPCCACGRGPNSTPSSTPCTRWSTPTASVSLFEYCLGRLLQVQVRESLDPTKHVRFGRRNCPPCAARSPRCCASSRSAATTAAEAHSARISPASSAYCRRDHLPYLPAQGRRAGARSGVGAARCARSVGQAGADRGITATISHDNPSPSPKRNCCARSAASALPAAADAGTLPVSRDQGDGRVALCHQNRLRFRSHLGPAPDAGYLAYRRAWMPAGRVWHHAYARIRSAARSAIMIVGAFVFPPISVGMTDASITRNPSTPRTRNAGSTTDAASSPCGRCRWGGRRFPPWRG